MAGVLATGAQTVFAGIAFAGAGMAMHLLEPNAFAGESKRHNKAMEKLALAKEKWQEAEIDNRNRQAAMARRLSVANADINQTNRDLDHLKSVLTSVDIGGKRYHREPVLHDFYVPSEKLQRYRTGVVGATSLAGGALATHLVSKMM